VHFVGWLLLITHFSLAVKQGVSGYGKSALRSVMESFQISFVAICEFRPDILWAGTRLPPNTFPVWRKGVNVRNAVSVVMNRGMVTLSGCSWQARAYVLLKCKKDAWYFRIETRLVLQAFLSFDVVQFTDDGWTSAYTHLLSEFGWHFVYAVDDRVFWFIFFQINFILHKLIHCHKACNFE
jgi:hypothetical protein